MLVCLTSNDPPGSLDHSILNISRGDRGSDVMRFLMVIFSWPSPHHSVFFKVTVIGSMVRMRPLVPTNCTLQMAINSKNLGQAITATCHPSVRREWFGLSGRQGTCLFWVLEACWGTRVDEQGTRRCLLIHTLTDFCPGPRQQLPHGRDLRELERDLYQMSVL